MNFPNENFSGYVLAGGRSRRMGRDKALLKFGPRTLFENARETLAKSCGGGVTAVLAADQQSLAGKLPGQPDFIFDIHESRGPLGGIHAALKSCPTEYAIVTAVDLPLLRDSLIRDMASALIGCESKAVVPGVSEGSLVPLCAAYRVEESLHTIEDVFRSGSSTSYLAVLAKLEPFRLPVRDEDQFLNTNTPEELEAARSRIA